MGNLYFTNTFFVGLQLLNDKPLPVLIVMTYINYLDTAFSVNTVSVIIFPVFILIILIEM